MITPNMIRDMKIPGVAHSNNIPELKKFLKDIMEKADHYSVDNFVIDTVVHLSVNTALETLAQYLDNEYCKKCDCIEFEFIQRCAKCGETIKNDNGL